MSEDTHWQCQWCYRILEGFDGLREHTRWHKEFLMEQYETYGIRTPEMNEAIPYLEVFQ